MVCCALLVLNVFDMLACILLNLVKQPANRHKEGEFIMCNTRLLFLFILQCVILKWNSVIDVCFMRLKKESQIWWPYVAGLIMTRTYARALKREKMMFCASIMSHSTGFIMKNMLQEASFYKMNIKKIRCNLAVFIFSLLGIISHWFHLSIILPLVTVMSSTVLVGNQILPSLI